MTTGKSPLERVKTENEGDSPSSSRSRRSVEECPSTDELFGLLSSGRRRRLVAHLHARDGPVSLSDAIEHVAESEGDDRRTSVATEFHHVHLPKLADADVVRHDRDADVLEAGANADRAVRLLESVTEEFSADSRDGRRSNPLADACSTDDAFRLLADRTRRILVSLLGGNDEQVHLDDLAERVAAWKEDKPVTEVTADERESTKIELHHKHLPKLADAGVLDYDRETKTLPDRGQPTAVAEWLVACPALETLRKASGA